jgi:(S)-2-hydroxyglutarate dehydrogenase
MAPVDPCSAPAIAVRAPAQCDLAIIGGGIVGLAVARELIRRNPRASVCVLEREAQLAAHQTGHNSGVIHAGVYYEPGSLKARLCVEGSRALYGYCEHSEIPSRRSGKLIIATGPSELPRLDELERRARANGVTGLRRLDAAGIREIEPHGRGVAALHSPDTGVVDFELVAQSLARDVLESGGTIVTGCEITDVASAARSLHLAHTQGAIRAGHAVFCAGAWSDRLAIAAGAAQDPRIVPFRGAYLRLAPERAHLVCSLIYPVPDPALPFLGVHLTRQIGGDVLLGPTALLALARDAYRLARIRGQDVIDTLAWPGTWKMLARRWTTGVTELHRAARRTALVRAAARYVPELEGSNVHTAFAGVRAQALSHDGRLIDDFVFSSTERALHIRNAPSPGATSSLAIARHVAARAQRVFGLEG